MKIVNAGLDRFNKLRGLRTVICPNHQLEKDEVGEPVRLILSDDGEYANLKHNKSIKTMPKGAQ